VKTGWEPWSLVESRLSHRLELLFNLCETNTIFSYVKRNNNSEGVGVKCKRGTYPEADQM